MRQLPLLALMLTLPLLLAGQQDTLYCDNLEGLEFDHDGDMVVGINDVLQLLTWYGYNYDIDQDGVLDCDDECVGEYDECGVCNGPGPQVLAIDTIIITYDSIYVEAIDEWLTYELSADTLLHVVCENPGCTDPFADNFDPYAEEGGSCVYSGDFDCGQPWTFVGHTYATVEIGGQCWFAENLRTTNYADGTSIQEVANIDAWAGLNTGARCDNGNDESNVSVYGRLYNWYAVIDARGLCPVGWHVPTDGEWTELEDYIEAQGFESAEGTALKSSTGWTVYNGSNGWASGNGTDDFGFSALPGGMRFVDPPSGWDSGPGYSGSWWSSSWYSSSYGYDYAWYRRLNGSSPFIIKNNQLANFGFSVRCLRDAD